MNESEKIIVTQLEAAEVSEYLFRTESDLKLLNITPY